MVGKVVPVLTITGFVKSTRSMAVALAAPQRPGVGFHGRPLGYDHLSKVNWDDLLPR